MNPLVFQNSYAVCRLLWLGVHHRTVQKRLEARTRQANLGNCKRMPVMPARLLHTTASSSSSVGLARETMATHPCGFFMPIRGETATWSVSHSSSLLKKVVFWKTACDGTDPDQSRLFAHLKLLAWWFIYVFIILPSNQSKKVDLYLHGSVSHHSRVNTEPYQDPWSHVSGCIM